MAEPGGQVVLTTEGRVEGTITHRMRGEGGFGYDPVFYYEPAGKTFAQMTPLEKNAVSHRGRALREFWEKLGLTHRVLLHIRGAMLLIGRAT